jgi:hypothetical protein
MLLVSGSILLACRIMAAAQPAPNQSPSSLLVNALDRNGDAVRDLTKDNFRVKVNGHPAALLDARYSLAPRRIVILLDVSGSMVNGTGSRKWQIARDAVGDLLASTPADVQLALLTFSSRIGDVFDFPHGRSSITTWLNSGPSQRSTVKALPETAFFDAVAAAAKLLDPARDGDVIYVITDGGDNRSHLSDADEKKRLLQSHIRLFAFLFAEEMPTPEESSGADSVVNLARDTGGYVFRVSSHWDGTAMADNDHNDRLRERMRLFGRALNIQVNGFYSLLLDAPTPTRKLSKVSLEIVDGKGKVRKDLTSIYQGILPEQGK